MTITGLEQQAVDMLPDSQGLSGLLAVWLVTDWWYAINVGSLHFDLCDAYII